jgi:hypothetical protein
MPKTLKDLQPNAENPRKVTDAKLAMLKKSLAEFGDLSGVVYNRKTKQLVGGHQRRHVLLSEPFTITKKYPKPTKVGTVAEGFIIHKGEKFAYREVEWDALKEKAANIAANKGAGEWDFTKLGEWMDELDGSLFDLDLTMFDEMERKDLFSGEVEVTDLPDLPNGEKSPLQQMTFTVHKDQSEEILRAIKIAKGMGAFEDTGNENNNGNGLARVCETFVSDHADS